MRDSTATAPLTSNLVEVQPREIIEDVFRALCAAGADPLEAQEGGRATLSAEVECGQGLSRLPELLGTRPWAATAQALVRRHAVEHEVVHELCSGQQPMLRTMLQLVDVACASSGPRISVAFSTDSQVPATFWTDLLRRRSRLLNRQILLVCPEGPVESANLLPSEQLVIDHATSLCRTGAAIIVLTHPPVHPVAPLSATRHAPVPVTDTAWALLNQAAHKYLASDQ